ncbi:MAG: YciI family protein [Pyrinomonadaceae bacterium]
MPNYMLLLHEQPPDFSQFSPEDIQAMIGEYLDWRRKIEADGKLVGGEKLKDEGGKHLSGANGDIRVTDGPFSEAKEVIGGYFAISAADYDEAVEISRSCPHLKYGGRIELREVESVH